MKADLTATARCSSLHLSSPLEHDAAGEAGSLNWSSTCATAHQGGSHGRSPPRLALGSSSIARQLLPHAPRAHSRVSCSRRAGSQCAETIQISSGVNRFGSVSRGAVLSPTVTASAMADSPVCKPYNLAELTTSSFCIALALLAMRPCRSTEGPPWDWYHSTRPTRQCRRGADGCPPRWIRRPTCMHVRSCLSQSLGRGLRRGRASVMGVGGWR